MNRQHMQKLVDDLNQDEEVENASVLYFLILVDGDIEVITQDGESRFIPIHYS
jgi:hypothetical protein